MTKLYYLVLFDCLSLFLGVVISLIKLILWLNFPTDKKAEGMVGSHGGRTIETYFIST